MSREPAIHPVHDDGRKRTADVVFVHGLGGHYRGTWDPGNGFFWPEHIAREHKDWGVWLLEYPADKTHWWFGGIGRHIDETADQLLVYFRDKGIGERPVAWVTHSLGGLVVKEVLRRAGERPDHRRLVASTQAVVFLATPHAGSGLASWASRLRPLFRPTDIFRDLARGSTPLRTLDGSFRALVNERRGTLDAFSLCEGDRSLGLLKPVSPSSADGGLPEPPKLINADHGGISKPASERAQVILEAQPRLDAALRPAPRPRDVPAAAGQAPEPSFPIWCDRVPVVTKWFTGRDELLGRLAAAAGDGSTRVLTQTVSGLGGVGKTTVAAAFAERQRPLSIWCGGCDQRTRPRW